MQGHATEQRRVWERYIAGSFQVKIPVSTGPAMRHAEETTYAILKARLDGWPHTSPWYPVLLRYVDLLAGRLRGIGVDPAGIPPSLGGYRPGKGRGHHESGERRRAFTGKVVSLVYDRFGDFRGFVLDTEDGDRRFVAREPAIERVVNRAWAERILTTVYVERHAPESPGRDRAAQSTEAAHRLSRPAVGRRRRTASVGAGVSAGIREDVAEPRRIATSQD